MVRAIGRGPEDETGNGSECNNDSFQVLSKRLQLEKFRH